MRVTDIGKVRLGYVTTGLMIVSPTKTVYLKSSYFIKMKPRIFRSRLDLSKILKLYKAPQMTLCNFTAWNENGGDLRIWGICKPKFAYELTFLHLHSAHFIRPPF